MQDPFLTPLFVTAGVTGSLAIPGIGSVSYAAILAKATVLAATVGASYAAQAFLAPTQKQGGGGGTQTLHQTIPAAIAALGESLRLPGRYMLYETKNGTSYDVIAFCEGPIGGFVKYYLHDDEVELDSGGFVLGLEDGRYGTNGDPGKVQIFTRVGELLETPYDEIITALPDIWTEDHRGDGMATAAMICKDPNQENFVKRFPNGLPQLSPVVDAMLVCDPRITGSDPDDISTWVVSSNPVLHILRFVTDPHIGMGMPWARMVEPNVTSLMEQADLCDVLVEKADLDVEPRYRNAMWWELTDDDASVLGSMLASCDGWLSINRDGALSLQVGSYEEPDVTLTDDDILGVTLNYGVPASQKVNELTITFTSPDHDYRAIDGKPWRDGGDVILRGKPRSQAFPLPNVPSHSQARRLAKRAFSRMNSPSGTLELSLAGLRCTGRRWVRVQCSQCPELEDAVIEIRPRLRKDFMARRTTVEFIIIDPDTIDAWDPETEEGEAPRQPTKLTRTELPVPDPVTAEIAGSEAEGFSFRIEFPNPDRDGLHYVIRYRLVDDGTGNPGPWIEQESQGDFDTVDPIVLMTPIVLMGTAYLVEVASVGTRGTRSEWSDAVYVYTTDDTLLLTEDGDALLTEDDEPLVMEAA